MHKGTKFSMLPHNNETFFISMCVPVYPENNLLCLLCRIAQTKSFKKKDCFLPTKS